jgi:O-antigen/teichoic acid export membrane protein
MNSLAGKLSIYLVSSVYTALLGVLTAPMLLAKLGSESYGLVSFMATWQAWFMLLDLGLSLTVAREASSMRGGGADSRSFWVHYRLIIRYFWVVAIIGGLVQQWCGPVLLLGWLNLEHLTQQDLMDALPWMLLVIGGRFMITPYRATLLGLEKVRFVSISSATLGTIRMLMILPILGWVSRPLHVYLVFQASLVVLELLATIWAVERLRRQYADLAVEAGPSLPDLWRMAKMSVELSVNGLVWTAVTQVDKILVSRVVLLSGFGHYSLSIALAGGVDLIANAFASVLRARFTILLSEGDAHGLQHAYRTATRVQSHVLAPIACTLVIFADQVLFAWTGDARSLHSDGLLLAFYAAGSCLLAMAALQSYLQFARATIRQHIVGNLFLLAVLLPVDLVLVKLNGALGAAQGWLLVNVIYIVFWVRYVHGQLMPGVHWEWLLFDVIRPLAPVLVGGLLLRIALPPGDGRIVAMMLVSVVAMAMSAISYVAFRVWPELNIRRTAS